MPEVTIFHNPACGTSRNVLALVRHAGIEPNVIKYPKTPPSKDRLPNQSSVAKAFNEFTQEGRMKPSAYYDRVVDVMEELVKFTLPTRDISPYVVDHCSERKESAEELSKRVNQSTI